MVITTKISQPSFTNIRKAFSHETGSSINKNTVLRFCGFTKFKKEKGRAHACLEGYQYYSK